MSKYLLYRIGGSRTPAPLPSGIATNGTLSRRNSCGHQDKPAPPRRNSSISSSARSSPVPQNNCINQQSSNASLHSYNNSEYQTIQRNSMSTSSSQPALQPIFIKNPQYNYVTSSSTTSSNSNVSSQGSFDSGETTPHASMESLPPPPAYLITTEQHSNNMTPVTSSAADDLSKRLSVADTVRTLTQKNHQPVSPNMVRRANSLKQPGEETKESTKAKTNGQRRGSTSTLESSKQRASLMQVLNQKLAQAQVQQQSQYGTLPKKGYSHGPPTQPKPTQNHHLQQPQPPPNHHHQQPQSPPNHHHQQPQSPPNHHHQQPQLAPNHHQQPQLPPNHHQQPQPQPNHHHQQPQPPSNYHHQQPQPTPGYHPQQHQTKAGQHNQPPSGHYHQQNQTMAGHHQQPTQQIYSQVYQSQSQPIYQQVNPGTVVGNGNAVNNSSPRHPRRFSEEILKTTASFVQNRVLGSKTPPPVVTSKEMFVKTLNATLSQIRQSPHEKKVAQQQQAHQHAQQQSHNNMQNSNGRASTALSTKNVTSRGHNSMEISRASRVRQWISSKTVSDPVVCRDSLMDQIRRGTKLKTTRSMNDRSAPRIH